MTNTLSNTILKIIEILKLIHKMFVQRTPPRDSGNAADDSIRDLSGSINVPEVTQRQNLPKVSTEKSKGVFTGT